MSNVHFISDLHWNHDKLATELRCFETVELHNKYILDCWNSKVHKKDTVYILGDITMEKDDYSFLDLLNGTKIVVGGNHDDYRHTQSLLNHVKGVSGMINYKRKEKKRFILTHCPVHPKELDNYESKGYYVWNFHGHVHNGYIIEDPRYINVCTEKINYTPKRLEELI
jgi:calcineurin-like phosphoesterase family protein